jgi:hypothetical protein
MYTFPREVAYAKLTSNLAIPAVGLALTEVLRLNIPSLPVPIYLQFETAVGYTQAGDGPGGIIMAIAPAAVPNQFGVIDGMHVYGVLDTTIEVGRKMFSCVRLPENSGGDYILGGARIGAGVADDDSASVIATSLVPTQFWATRA